MVNIFHLLNITLLRLGKLLSVNNSGTAVLSSSAYSAILCPSVRSINKAGARIAQLV